ncbi:MAG: D-alanyl-D-alanine carboxypeptidase [Lachnospiraceae bacterium]|nr:D-alanyl-D-alanine carboxypeptidase [Lachnospiraceae bacterium]
MNLYKSPWTIFSRKISQRIGRILLSAFLCISIMVSVFQSASLTTFAAPVTLEDFEREAEERKSLPIQSNQIENWPVGPAISAQSAIVMEANTGVILYAKNIDEKLYPASTTKLMTCLVAAENAKMDEMVTFSYDAVFSIESGSSNIGIDAGQAMTMEESLYGILTASANEVANGVAEHVAGSMDAFTVMMNEKAAELGCKNTHFVNAHGLYDDEHYTTAYDLALIARAFFQDDHLSKIGNTASYHFQPTATQPDDFIVRNKHKLITGEIEYEGIEGGKTGYTDEARQTLVTCAEQNGMKLICVVMKEESPDQFYDTVTLLDYGFTNFSVANVAANETRYTVQGSDFFDTSNDIFGNSDPILSLNKDSYVILPGTITFEELESEISYDTTSKDEVAYIHYSYHDNYLGTAIVNLVRKTPASYDFTTVTQTSAEKETNEGNVIVVNVKLVLIAVVAVAALLVLVFFIHSVIINYHFSGAKRSKEKRKAKYKYKFKTKKNRKDGLSFPSSRFNDFDL